MSVTSQTENGLFQRNVVNSVAIFAICWSQTTSVSRDFSDSIWLNVSMVLSPIRSEIIGRPHPYHLKAGYMKSINRFGHGSQQALHTFIKDFYWLVYIKRKCKKNLELLRTWKKKIAKQEWLFWWIEWVIAIYFSVEDYRLLDSWSQQTLPVCNVRVTYEAWGVTHDHIANIRCFSGKLLRTPLIGILNLILIYKVC